MSKMFNINLDVRKNNYICLSGFKVGDNLSTINGTMLQSSVPYNLTGLTLRANFKDSQGNLYFQDSSKGVSIINPLEGTFKIDVVSSVLSVEGIIKADISIFKGTQKLTSSTFSMEVVETVYKDGAIVGEDGKDLLQGIVEGESKRINAEVKREANEVVREKGEVKREEREMVREDNESKRKQGYSTMDTRIDNLILGQGSQTEVIDAHLDGVSSKVYPTLKARLDHTSKQLLDNALSTITTSNYITSLDNATDGLMQIDSIKGRTLQNLCNGDFRSRTNGGLVEVSKNKIVFKKVSTPTDHYRASANIPLAKPNTQYTLIFNVSGAEMITNDFFLSHSNYNDTTGINDSAIKLSNGFNVITFKSKPIFEATPVLFFYLGRIPDLTKDVIIENVMLLEGDYTSHPPRFFEGIESVGDFEGGNLFDKSKIITGGLLNGLNGTIAPNPAGCYSDYINVMSNSSYTLSIGLESSSYGHCFYNASKEFISGVVSSLGGSQTVIIPSNAMYIRLSLRIADVDKQQFEKGSISTLYRPYQDYKVEILSVGKNLFDKNKTVSGTFNLDGTVTGSDQIYSASDFIRVEPNKDYFIGARGSGVGKLYDIYKRPLQKESFDFTISGAKFNIDNVAVAYIRFRVENKLVNDLQVERGAIATPYITYKGDKSEISLGSPLFGLPNGIVDEIIGDRVYRRIGKDILNGSETWVIYPTSLQSHVVFVLNNFIKPKFGSIILSNQFEDVKEVWTKEKEGICMHTNSTRLFITISKAKLATPDAVGFKKWLSSNPTEVYYELKESTISSINPTSLKSFKDGSIILNNVITPTIDLKYPTSIGGRLGSVESTLDNTVDRIRKLEEALFVVTAELLEARKKMVYIGYATLNYFNGASGTTKVYKNMQVINVQLEINFQEEPSQNRLHYATVQEGFRPISNIMNEITDATGSIVGILEIETDGKFYIRKKGSLSSKFFRGNITYMTAE